MRYRVTDCHIQHDGKTYAPGEDINLTEEQAKGLHVELAPSNEQAPEDMTNKQLTDLLTGKGVDVPAKATKPQLLELLAAASKKEGGAE